MKRPSSAEQRKWDAELKASGFQDLETAGGLLSNRGTVSSHEDSAHHVTPEARAETEAYYDNAREVARTHRFASRRDREIWTLHAERPTPTQGGTLRSEIARRLGVTQWEVRQSIARTETAVAAISRKGSNPVNPGRAEARERVDRMVRSMDVEMLVMMSRGLPA